MAGQLAVRCDGAEREHRIALGDEERVKSEGCQMGKLLRCADVRPTRCPEEFRGESNLEVLALIVEHWTRVHEPQPKVAQPIQKTTSVLLSRMRSAIRDE
jgi:hypothetical protein